ncbi:uncharacterized protein N7484_000147 [Penicillium longicatenatum]|jgi:hypothetical protein|uniref:uncharacterized protein n=1 Tax=Penicillium longicatenatum TaxID=1561947 RepID=UPI0025494A7C|nr:uncharacterized protein N7484_000147 [Penicillium longicatenatum]KAJ5660775.1 hypothetical protein N7484_000147 [Penicillium longicatenatum]KAJ5667535.1 hypothetical protein N7507_003399 [Penicillium longicatenatum]
MPDSKEQESIRTALDRARTNDPPVDASTSSILEAAIADLWTRIQAEQDTIVLTSDEFALFNYFLPRLRINHQSITQRVVNRYWNSFHDSKGGKK